MANWFKRLFSHCTEINTQTINNSGTVQQADTINNYGISDETLQIILADYKQKQKADAEQLKQYKQMLEDLRSGKVDASPSAIEAAFAALQKGDTSLAESLFEKLVEEELKKAAESNKNAANALRNLGTLRWWESQKALAAYQRATELDPDNADDWNRLGLLLCRTGKLNEAIAAYQTVLKLGLVHQNPKEISWAFCKLGNVYRTSNELDKAIKMYGKALAIDEQMDNKLYIAEDYSLLGTVYEQKCNKAEAKLYWQKSLELYKYIGSPNEKLVQKWLDDLK
jgi:tetratricopeptide (TPR) repeat protein